MARREARIERRKRQRRTAHRRRRHDFYREMGKLAGLVFFVCTAIVGQAELIGEPWRHYVTVASTIAAAVWAYCMQPAVQIRRAMGGAARAKGT